MKLLQRLHKKLLLLSAFLVGFFGSGLCATYENLEEQTRKELKSFVGSKEFLHQFAKMQHLSPEIAEQNIRISMEECFGTTEIGYPRYIASCIISPLDLQSQTHSQKPLILSISKAIVHIADNGILKMSSESKWVPPVLRRVFSKKGKSATEETTEGYSKGKGSGNYSYQLLSSSDEFAQAGQSSIIKHPVDKQKRIFVISSMTWDPLFRIRLSLASKITTEDLLSEKPSYKIPSESIMKEITTWVRNGMASHLEKCPDKIVGQIKDAVNKRVQQESFEFSSIDYFVYDLPKTLKLHIVTLAAQKAGQTFFIGAALLSSTKDKTNEENDTRIYLTNFLENKEPAELNAMAESFKLPLTSWSLKKESIPRLSGKISEIFQKFSTISDSPCVTYILSTDERNRDLYKFQGRVLVENKNCTIEIVQVDVKLKSHGDAIDVNVDAHRDVVDVTADTVFGTVENISDEYPNWVTKINLPNLAFYNGLEAELERIRQEYVTAISRLFGKSCKKFNFEWEFLMEAIVSTEGNDYSKIVVHAFHVEYRKKHYETKYIFAVVSDKTSTVTGLKYDPAIWCKKKLDDWRKLQLNPPTPFKIQLVWGVQVPDKFQLESLLDNEKVQEALTDAGLAGICSYAERDLYGIEYRREFFGYSKHGNNQNIFIVYHCGLNNRPGINHHYKLLRIELNESPFKIISATTTHTTHTHTTTRYDSAESARDAAEDLILLNS